MRRLVACVLCFFAMWVMLKGGHEAIIPDVVGFTIEDREYGVGEEKITQAVMVLRDKKAEEVTVIPLEMVGLGVFIADDKLI